MAVIVPRWEWRTFAPNLRAAENALAALTPGAVAESDEIYLLSDAKDTVKIRDDLLDIKVLNEVDADGLEQWAPSMKATFPLPATDVAKVFRALGIAVPTLQRDEYSEDQFLSELVTPDPGIRSLNVHKRRSRYTVGGCMAESANVTADGKQARTIAVESEDPAAVMAAVRELGLADFVNTSYPRGLAAIIDGLAPRYAVIDVGTNSVKFHIGERSSDGAWRTIVDRADVSRLGEGMDANEQIGQEPLERTAAAIAEMVREATSAGVLAIAAVGTAGLRKARNKDDVLSGIRARAGVTVNVITGEEEGRLAYLAVKEGLGLGEGQLTVFDTGGGSTQFTFGAGQDVEDMFSVEVGAVRYTERFALAGVVAREVLREVVAAIAADLARIDGRQAPDVLVGMGGAVTNMTAVKHALATYDPDVVQGTVLDRAEVDRQIELYRSLDSDGRRPIVGLQPNRADVILAGACIVRTIMEKLGRESLTVSDRGLRHGLLFERFGQPS